MCKWKNVSPNIFYLCKILDPEFKSRLQYFLFNHYIGNQNNDFNNWSHCFNIDTEFKLYKEKI